MFLGIPEEEMDEDDFRKKMTRFLFGSVGSKHRLLLSYDDEIICGEPAPAINVNIVGLYRCITNTPSYVTDVYDTVHSPPHVWTKRANSSNE